MDTEVPLARGTQPYARAGDFAPLALLPQQLRDFARSIPKMRQDLIDPRLGHAAARRRDRNGGDRRPAVADDGKADGRDAGDRPIADQRVAEIPRTLPNPQQLIGVETSVDAQARGASLGDRPRFAIAQGT